MMLSCVTQQYMANVDVEGLKQDEDALTHFIKGHVMPGTYRRFILQTPLNDCFIYESFNRMAMLYGCRQNSIAVKYDANIHLA